MTVMRPDTTVADPYVQENTFIGRRPSGGRVPGFSAVRHLLPEPRWDARPDVISCSWKAWELAFRHLRVPTRRNGFITPYIDTAFNGHIFMWDSVFMLFFGRYGIRAFDFQRTLDNFYAKQHADGYICREIDEATGNDLFEKYDPSSTGPNLFPWSEWEHYRWTGNRARLQRVYPVVLALFRWFDTYRTWPDGSCFTNGYGSGMDNQPRCSDPRFNPWKSHGHLSWIDATAQHAFAARNLCCMASTLGDHATAAALEHRARQAVRYINGLMWHDGDRFYYDRTASGALTRLKTVGAYWTLLAGAVPRRRTVPFIAHLEDPRSFNRPHRVPSLPADHPAYRGDGGYWLGGVWPSTTYMVLRGLTAAGEHRVAHDIARNHLDQVVAVYRNTGTLWENYAPERAKPGNPAKPDFVGWTGVVPIAVLLECVFGIRADVPANLLMWDLRLTDAHGVERYPFGTKGLVSLYCARRRSAQESPCIRASSNIPLTVRVRWQGGTRTLRLPGRR